jgi:hypothetical protein
VNSLNPQIDKSCEKKVPHLWVYSKVGEQATMIIMLVKFSVVW